MKTAVQGSWVFLACIEQDNDGPTGWNFGRCALCPSQPLYQTLRDVLHPREDVQSRDGSVGLVRGVAERRWPPSFSPTELLWKTTGSCLMMLGAGSGIGCFLGVSLGVAVCCQSSGTRAFCQGPRHLRGTVPGVAQGPRHLRGTVPAISALGTCGSGLRRRRCAGCVAVLITARALCTLVLPSPSLFRRGWPPPGLSPPCVRALGTCRRGLLCLLGAFAPLLAPEGLIRALGT